MQLHIIGQVLQIVEKKGASRETRSSAGKRNQARGPAEMAEEPPGRRQKLPTSSTVGRQFFRMASGDNEGTYVGEGDDGVSSIDADQSGMRIIRYAVSVRDPTPFALFDRTLSSHLVHLLPLLLHLEHVAHFAKPI
jgi:hypothetical protein